MNQLPALTLDSLSEAQTVVEGLVPYLTEPNRVANDLLDACEAALSNLEWTADPDHLAERVIVHDITAALGKAVNAVERASRLIVDDIAAALSEPATLGVALEVAASSSKHLIKADCGRLAAKFPLYGSSSQDLHVPLMRARILLARRADVTAAQAAKAPFWVATSILRALATTREAAAIEIVGMWIERLTPLNRALRAVLRGFRGRLPWRLNSSIALWAESVGVARRTSFVADILKRRLNWPRAARTVSKEGVKKGELFELGVNLVQSAAQHEERRRLVRILIAVRPDTERSQDLWADLLMWLLSTSKHVDFDIAQFALVVADPRHPRASEVVDQIRSVAKGRRWKVQTRTRDYMARAG